MRYTKLGQTGLDVSVIGIGTEHMHGQPFDSVVATLREAVERGVNYFDVIFTLPDFLDRMRAGFQGLRDRALLTSHLGSIDKNGQYQRTRVAKRCQESFLGGLKQLNTDYADVLMLHCLDTPEQLAQAARSGYLDLAQRLKEQGKARLIGISGHYPDVIRQVIQDGMVDLIMLPVSLFNHAMPHRQELLDLCVRQGIGVVAMKPYGGGKLLNKRGTIRVPGYQIGAEPYQARIAPGITPVQCLSYVLAQPGVSVALPGVKNQDELAQALDTLEAGEAERDYSALLTGFGRYVEGECTYCNHCLPCPAVIDIGQVNRLLDLAELGLSPSLQAAYDALPVKASACTECGGCTPRCPFGVDVVPRLRQAVHIFETEIGSR